LNGQRFFHRFFYKSLTCFAILVLVSGLADARTQPTHSRDLSKRKSSAVSSRKSSPRVDLVSAKSRKAKFRKTKTKKVRGQQVIQGDRAREIQTALIREGYLNGQPSGVWDQQTKDAMTRYQADHGWQTKTLPDSRALIQLGLGPDHKNAINAQATQTVLPAQVSPVKNSELPENRQ
jgi:peptidoglycan hydrolase-like protein with peptidoglycan-binding domain